MIISPLCTHKYPHWIVEYSKPVSSVTGRYGLMSLCKRDPPLPSCPLVMMPYLTTIMTSIFPLPTPSFWFSINTMLQSLWTILHSFSDYDILHVATNLTYMQNQASPSGKMSGELIRLGLLKRARWVQKLQLWCL